jgi:ubiquinone/menaquinone biosynthesis C-methylase UbiE
MRINLPELSFISKLASFIVGLFSALYAFFSIDSTLTQKVQEAYGKKPNNWGDLEVFAGGYINFGYWKDLDLNKPITLWERKESSYKLYQYVIDALGPIKNKTVLELGCGRGIGALDSFTCLKDTRFIGVDITSAQIERAQKFLSTSAMNTSCFIFKNSAIENMNFIADKAIDAMFSVEVLQHVEDFSKLAQEIKRVLTSEGRFVFVAHLSLDQNKHDTMKREGLIIDDADVLMPLNVIKEAFEKQQFQTNCLSIGEHVFQGYDKWVSQVNPNDVSHNIYKSYISGYIDYFLCIITPQY